MSLQQAFLHSIIESPDDDTPRLAYSDWLEENGEPARAEFIRVQCRLAALDQDDPQYRDLQRREYELLAEHWGEWAGPLVGRVRRWRFRRGFVEQVKLEAGQFLKEAHRLLELAPIQELRVRHPTLEELRALLSSRYIGRITRLNLEHAGLGDAGAALLSEAPKLARLTDLSLRFNELGVAGLAELARSSCLQSLRSLDVTANDLPDGAFAELLADCRLPLETLRWDDAVGTEGARSLAASPLAGRLKALHLRDAHLGAEGLRLLTEAPALPRLEELSIERDEIASAGFVALAAGPLLQRLTSLELSCVAADEASAIELARSAPPPALRRLDLSFNKIGPVGARALVAAPLCGSLTRLVLSGTSLGDGGIEALARSPQLANLRRLELWKCGVSGQGVKALLASPHLDRLSCLRLGDDPIPPRPFAKLKGRLGERLYHADFEQPGGREIIRRVKAEPPRCLRGLGARTDTALLRRFPRRRLHPGEYASISFELTHPDPQQKPLLLGYEDTRGYDIFFSPYAVRWEPSGEQREFFDAEQHGGSGESGSNCTIIGSGKRKPWRCGRRGCRDHAFLVTFIYRIEYPPVRSPDRYLPLADQFYHIDLDAYCATQDRVIQIASFECK